MIPRRLGRNRRVAVACCLGIGLVWSVVNVFSADTPRPAQSSDDRPLVLARAHSANKKIRRLQHSLEGRGFEWRLVTQFQDGKSLDSVRDQLAPYKDDGQKIVIVSDEHVIFTGDARPTVEIFQSLGCRVLISARQSCIPENAQQLYPPSKQWYRYVDSALFMGYARDVYRLLNDETLSSEANERVAFAKIYLDPVLRQRYGIQADQRALVFQNLDHAVLDADIRFDDSNKPYFFNTFHLTKPTVLRAHDYVYRYMNLFTNFFPNEWNPSDGCITCLKDTKNLSLVQPGEYPKIVVGVVIENRTAPHVGDFLDKLVALDYPKRRLHLIVRDQLGEGETSARATLTADSNDYDSVEFCDLPTSRQCRQMAVQLCVESDCDFYWHLDSSVKLENAMTLRLLVEQNRPVVAPYLSDHDGYNINFDVVLFTHGNRFIPIFFKSFEYHPELDIPHHRGLWSGHFVGRSYLIRRDVLDDPKTRPSFHPVKDDWYSHDTSFSDLMMYNGVDLWMTNRFDFGHFWIHSDH